MLQPYVPHFHTFCQDILWGFQKAVLPGMLCSRSFYPHGTSAEVTKVDKLSEGPTVVLETRGNTGTLNIKKININTYLNVYQM